MHEMYLGLAGVEIAGADGGGENGHGGHRQAEDHADPRRCAQAHRRTACNSDITGRRMHPALLRFLASTDRRTDVVELPVENEVRQGGGLAWN